MGVTDPELAVVLVLDAPVATSRLPVVAMPENSCTPTAMVVAEFVWAITLLTALALGEYHISPSELCPEAANAPIRVQMLPAESVTEVIGLVNPV